MQAENARRAAEMLKQSGELARTAAEMFDGGAAEEAVQKRLEQPKTLPTAQWSCWNSTMCQQQNASLRFCAGWLVRRS